MRLRVVLLVLAAAVTAALIWRATERTTTHRTSAPPPSAVSLVGDSLNVGIESDLRGLLPGWRFGADDELGRPTATGLERLRAAGSSLSPYVVISLGTNDPSTVVDAFRRAVEEVLQLAGPHRCVVWATIHREGDAYAAFNEILRSEAARNRNLRLVEWSNMIERDRNLLAADGIHGTPDGYRARAEAVIEQLRACYDAGVTA